MLGERLLSLTRRGSPCSWTYCSNARCSAGSARCRRKPVRAMVALSSLEHGCSRPSRPWSAHVHESDRACSACSAPLSALGIALETSRRITTVCMMGRFYPFSASMVRKQPLRRRTTPERQRIVGGHHESISPRRAGAELCAGACVRRMWQLAAEAVNAALRELTSLGLTPYSLLRNPAQNTAVMVYSYTAALAMRSAGCPCRC